MTGRHHHYYGATATISQHDIHQILLNVEQLFLAIFLIVSFCLMLQLLTLYFIYVTFHRDLVRRRSNTISPPSYEASREHPNVQQKSQILP